MVSRRRSVLLLAAVLSSVVVGGAASAGPVTLAAPLCGQTRGLIASVPTGTPMRIASYNMLHGLTAEGDRTLEARLAIDVDELTAANVDIVGIQEAEQSTKHGRVIERLANRLAARTSQRWFWCWFRTEPHVNGTPDTRSGGGSKLSDLLAEHYNSNEPKWYEGAAVLSRWPIVASAVHRLPGEDPAQRLASDCKPPAFSGDPSCTVDIVLEPRAAVWTRIATPLGHISFTSTHTSGNWEQSQDLVRWVQQQDRHDGTAFLVCDCNSVESSRAQQAIRANGWHDVYRAMHPSGGATVDQDIGAAHATTTYRIDYIFQGASDHGVRAIGATRFMNVPERSNLERSGWLWPSDHWGVLATVR
jgi:endonuclease/exonuclease/phosphatase family metal-dependent hydrolase